MGVKKQPKGKPAADTGAQTPGQQKVMGILTTVFKDRPATLGELQAAIAPVGEDAGTVIQALQSHGWVVPAGGGLVATKDAAGAFCWLSKQAPAVSTGQSVPPPVQVAPPPPPSPVPAHSPPVHSTAMSTLPPTPPASVLPAAVGGAGLAQGVPPWEDSGTQETDAEDDGLALLLEKQEQMLEKQGEMVELLKRVVLLLEGNSGKSVAPVVTPASSIPPPAHVVPTWPLAINTAPQAAQQLPPPALPPPAAALPAPGAFPFGQAPFPPPVTSVQPAPPQAPSAPVGWAQGPSGWGPAPGYVMGPGGPVPAGPPTQASGAPAPWRPPGA